MLVCVFLAEETAMKTATDTLLIKNGQLVDGTGAPPIREAALIAREGSLRYDARRVLRFCPPPAVPRSLP